MTSIHIITKDQERILIDEDTIHVICSVEYFSEFAEEFFEYIGKWMEIREEAKKILFIGDDEDCKRFQKMLYQVADETMVKIKESVVREISE